MTKKHGQKVLKSLIELEARRKKLLGLGKKMLLCYGGTTYKVDLLAIGAIKRAISTIAGFRLLVDSWNLLCARALLRIQIDTALRFYSIYLVKEPHDFAIIVLEGQQINHLKDIYGNRMTDAYLISKLKLEYPWLPKVYKNISGYIHLSDHHYFSTIQDIDDKSKTVHIRIHEKDLTIPEDSWLEMIACFNEATDISIRYLEGWIFTKSNPEIVAKLKKRHITNE